MKICLVTYYNKKYKRIGELCRRSLKKYASLHNYDVKIFNQPLTNRPASWNKILIVKQLFKQNYEYVFWMDADAIFVRFDKNIVDEIENDKFLYIVNQKFNKNKKCNGTIPNFGVFLIKNSEWSIKLLDAIYNKTEYINHLWWEQAALIDCLGLIDQIPEEKKVLFGEYNKIRGDSLLKNIKWLPLEWNVNIFYLNNLNIYQSHYLKIKPIIDHHANCHTNQNDFAAKLWYLSISSYKSKQISLYNFLSNIFIALFLRFNLLKIKSLI